VENVKNFIRDGFNAAKDFVTTAFNNIATAVSTGIDNAVNFVRGLPDQITGALGNLGSLLTNAGGQIIEGFLSGLKAGFETVKNFVGGIGDWIAKNKGPKAYDLALLIPNGGWIMKGLKKGIENGIPDLNKTLSNVAKTASKGLGDMSANVMVGTQSTIPQEVGRGLNRNVSTQGAESRGTIVQNVTITIDAKNVKDFNDVVNVMNNISQTARQGRGTPNARIA
jgi:phage-related protein